MTCDCMLICFVQMKTMEKNQNDLRNAGSPFLTTVVLFNGNCDVN